MEYGRMTVLYESAVARMDVRFSWTAVRTTWAMFHSTSVTRLHLSAWTIQTTFYSATVSFNLSA